MKYIIGWFGLVLTACTDVAATKIDHEVLEHRDEVSPWVTRVQMEAIKEAQRLSAQHSGALLTVALPSNTPQFFAIKQADTGKTVLNPQKITQANDLVGTEVGSVSDLSKVQINRYALLSSVRKSIDLSQASLTDLQYAGLLTQNTKTWGMVKVGERLYPINVGDVIGQGHWPVISLNAQNMQLKIANKAVTYDKY